MRALVVAILICAGAPAALAQSYSVSGQVGYLQEWEMKASLAKTVAGRERGVFRPGDAAACRAVQHQRRRGKIRRAAVDGFARGVEGTLALAGDSCRIVAAASRSYSGLMNCRNGHGVPINFTIEQAGAAGQNALAAEK